MARPKTRSQSSSTSSQVPLLRNDSILRCDDIPSTSFIRPIPTARRIAFPASSSNSFEKTNYRPPSTIISVAESLFESLITNETRTLESA